MTVRLKDARLAVLAVAVVAVAAHGWKTSAQAPAPAAPRATTAPDAIVANSYTNPFVTTADFFKMPAGRKWGSTAGVDIDRDGKTVWIIDRCGGNSCYDAAAGKMSDLDPILHFDETGQLIKSFGAGLIVFPHGIDVDRDGNVWVTDGNDNRPNQGRGAAAAAGGGAGRGPAWLAQRRGRRRDIRSSSSVLTASSCMTLGTPGGAAEPDYFYQPNDVLVAPNGDIFVGEDPRRWRRVHLQIRQDREVPDEVGARAGARHTGTAPR